MLNNREIENDFLKLFLIRIFIFIKIFIFIFYTNKTMVDLYDTDKQKNH